MTDDATLSDFEEARGGADGEQTTDSRTDESPESNGESADETAVDPVGDVRATYAWGEYTCEKCETTTERVWREEESFVCPACKSW